MSGHIAFVVNGTPAELDIAPRRLLVEALRNDLDRSDTHRTAMAEVSTRPSNRAALARLR